MTRNQIFNIGSGIWLYILFCVFAFVLRAEPQEPSTNGIPCSNFSWIADNNSPKAGIRVPISISGHRYWYQLDTGADVVMAYGDEAHKKWVTKKDFTLVDDVQFAGMHLASIPLFRMKNVSDKDIQGTVGLDILVGHLFIIDFPKQRVCLLPRAEFPDSLNQAADWTPTEIRDGKLFLDGLTLNGKELSNVIYDSGTSPDELAVDFPLWKQATGKEGADDASTHVTAQTWGQMVQYIGARATGTLDIGKRAYAHPMLTTAPSRPNNFHNNVYGASGALGNAFFFKFHRDLGLRFPPRVWDSVTV
jgi:hypothetical protein